MDTSFAVKLKPATHFREYPFGWPHHPSIREAVSDRPQEHQAELVAYLRSGYVLGYLMGGDLPDFIDPPARANPLIEGQSLAGATPMTDGVWIWPAGLIYYVEKYNVKLAPEFVEHAARNCWRIDKEAVSQGVYDYEY